MFVSFDIEEPLDGWLVKLTEWNKFKEAKGYIPNFTAKYEKKSVMAFYKNVAMTDSMFGPPGLLSVI